MNEKEMLYYLTLILKQAVIYQGEFDTPKVNYFDVNDFQYRFYAECMTRLLSNAFGVFLLIIKKIIVRCRSPPSINFDY